MERRNIIIEFVPTESQLEQVEAACQSFKDGTANVRFNIAATPKREELKVRCSGVSGIVQTMFDPEIRANLLAYPVNDRDLITHQFLKERDTYFAECTLLMPDAPRPYNRDVSLQVEGIQDKLTKEEIEELKVLVGCEAVELRLEDDCINAYYGEKLLGEAEGYQTDDVKNFIKMGFDVWANSIFVNEKRNGEIDFAIRAYSNVTDFSELDVLFKEYPIEHIEKAFLLLKIAGLSPNSDEWEVLADDEVHIDRDKLKRLPSCEHPRLADTLRDRMRRATATNPTNPDLQMGVPYDFDIYGITWDDIKIENKDLLLKLFSDNWILATFIRLKRRNFGLTVEEFIKKSEHEFGPLSDTVKKRIERFNAPYSFG